MRRESCRFVVLGLTSELHFREGAFKIGLEGFVIGIFTLLHHGVAGHGFGIAAQQNIGAAAGHVSGNRYGTLAAGLRYDVGFAFMVLGVENLVPDAHFLEEIGQALGFFDRDCTHQNGLAALLEFLDFFGGVAEFFVFRAIDNVLILLADHRLVGRNFSDLEFINLFEFRRFGGGRTGHAGQFRVHTEVVLEGDGGERLILALDFDAFLGLDCLVQTIAPAPARHQAAGVLVDDDDFAVFDHVILVALENGVGLEGRLDVVVPFHILRLVHVADAEQFLDAQNAFFGERRGAMLFVDGVVAGGIFFAGLFAFDYFAALQVWNDLVRLVVLVGGFFAGAGDDERRARFVDEDGIDFIDDGEVVSALHAVLNVELHVVAQVIEAELVVRAVGDVAVVVHLAFAVVEIVYDNADRQTQKAVNAAHPVGIAMGEVVVYGDDVDTFAAQRIQIAGGRGDQGFAFASLHFSDPALVQNHAADELDVEVAHAEDAAAGFANHCERFDQEVVERSALGQFLLKFDCFRRQIDVGKALHRRLEIVYCGNDRTHCLDLALVPGAEDFG